MIANDLDGKPVEDNEPLDVFFNEDTAVYIFKDGSRAIKLTILEKVQPYVAATQSTLSLVGKRIWKAL